MIRPENVDLTIIYPNEYYKKHSSHNYNRKSYVNKNAEYDQYITI
ncbi:MAG: hypothetical protein PARBA_03453 [Parabacteroides sp.]